MKKFLIHIFLFLLPIVVSSYFVDCYLSNSLKKSLSHAAGEITTWESLYNGKVDSDIVIYGSSRAWKHIDPAIITNKLGFTAYNLGIDGHNFWLQYLRHKVLLSKNKKPKLIIHSVDAFTLVKRNNLFNSDQFLPYMLWNNQIYQTTKSYDGFNTIDFMLPLIRYYGKLEVFKTVFRVNFRPQNNIALRIKGYQGEDAKWNGDFDTAKKHFGFYQVKLDSASIQLFDDYLKECKAKKIEVMLVYTPEYIEGQYFIKNRAHIIALYVMFSEKYNIKFYDFSKDSICFKKEYFYNAMHLNKTGSTLFTNKLIDTLKNNYVKSGMLK